MAQHASLPRLIANSAFLHAMSVIVQQELSWNKFENPKPYVTVAGFAVDDDGSFPILYRSDKVRSAKNCWSIPTGLHEVGVTASQQLAVEMNEELNLEAYPGSSKLIGMYENIRPDGTDVFGWHWVVLVMAIKVESLKSLVNVEPQKHSEIKIFNINVPDWIDLPWEPRLGGFVKGYQSQIVDACRSVTNFNPADYVAVI